jgi:D-alanine-D-alanine ligase
VKKVLIIYGGKSYEHDISIKSYNNVINNIDKEKYIVDSIYITKDNKWLNNDIEIDNIINFIRKFDVVFPIIHGFGGEDGKLQGMLDLFNIKYIGSKCGSSYICMDKIRTKEILSNYDIPQVPYKLYDGTLDIDYPVIIKPSNGGSSIGINVANNKEEFDRYIEEGYKYDNKVIVEKFIKNPKEIECACLIDKDNLIIEIGSVEQNSTFYDYKTKYENDSIVTNIDPQISDDTKDKLKEYCNKIFNILDLDNLARIDFLLDKDNIYLNEINTIPGFTDISMFPMLINKTGISYKEIITKLIENAI